MSLTFLIAFLSAAVLAILALILCPLFIEHRASQPAKHSEAEEGVAKEVPLCLNGHEEIPLNLRQRTMKICPDCRELVLLEANACKYCGCALEVEEKKQPALVLRRADRMRSADGRKNDAKPVS